MVYHVAENKECLDAGIKMVHCGKEMCTPKHSFGPVMRDHYLIHYVESGKGRFEINNKVYHLEEGEIFYIAPNVITYYEADEKDPWVYKWIGIKGRYMESVFKMTGISVKRPVMAVSEDVSLVMDRIIDEIASGDCTALRLSSLAYEFLDKLIKNNSHEIEKKSNSQVYVEKAVDYIWQYIYRKVSVEELAGYVNVDRSYLSSIFKDYTGLSPQKYIMDIKMKTACEYLLSTDYDITYIAQSVGYEDLFVFSHAFKKFVGVSPKEYRKGVIVK